MPEKRDRALLFAVAFAARLAAAAARGLLSVRFGDSLAYVSAAQRLVREGSYPGNTDRFFFRAPGYPFFLAASTLGHPGWIALDKVWNALLGALFVVVLAAIARRVFASREVALAVGGIAALHPPFLFLGSQIQSEPLYLVLAAAAGFLLLVCVDRPSSGMGLLAGGSLALASLVRPSALVLFPLLAAPLFDRRYPPRVRRALAGSAVLGFCLALAPWTLRNAVRFHAVLPVNDEAGFTFYQGNSDWNVRFYRLRSGDDYRKWIAEMNLAMQSRWGSDIPGLADPNPSRRSFALAAAGIRWARAHPREEAWLLGKKALEWLRPGASPLVRSRTVVALTTIYYGALFLVAAVGLATARRRGIVGFCIATLAITMALHVALLVLLRYRMASWDPILILYAPSGILRVLGGIRR